MLIRRLKVSGLLLFGPKGIDLSMEPLNVLVGPNGSGKSNLLEVLASLRALPVKRSRHPRVALDRRAILAGSGRWKRSLSVLPSWARRHALTFADTSERLQVIARETSALSGGGETS